MSIKSLLSILKEVAKKNRIRTPYIVGGVPRDLVLDVLDEVNDLDITTGSDDVFNLAQKFAEEIDAPARKMGDGHLKVVKDGISFDFSSNFNYENIDEFLAKRGMFHPSDLMRETYSRDFTVNTLLVPLNFGKVFDLTGMGLVDLEKKVLRCPVDCNASFVASPIRMVRVFYYAARYDFSFDDEIKEAIKKNLALLHEVDRRYSSEKINFILRKSPELIDEMISLGMFKYLPLTKELSHNLIKNRKILDVL